LCNGEPKASVYLTQRLRDELGVDAVIQKGKVYDLNNKVILIGNQIKYESVGSQFDFFVLVCGVVVV